MADTLVEHLTKRFVQRGYVYNPGYRVEADDAIDWVEDQLLDPEVVNEVERLVHVHTAIAKKEGADVSNEQAVLAGIRRGLEGLVTILRERVE